MKLKVALRHRAEEPRRDPNGTCAKRRRRLLARDPWGLAQCARGRGAVGKSRASRSMRSTVPIGDDRGDGSDRHPDALRRNPGLCGQLRAKVGGHLLGRFAGGGRQMAPVGIRSGRCDRPVSPQTWGLTISPSLQIGCHRFPPDAGGLLNAPE